MLKRLLSLLTIAVVACGISFVAVSPASAASCSAGKVCFWQYSNYAGFTYSDYYPNPCLNINAPMNNEATSIIVGSRPGGGQEFISFYNAQGCQGDPVWWLYTGQSTASVSVAANNVISSMRRSATP